VNPGVVAMVQGHILRAAKREGVAVSVYCFMPDHVHVVLRASRTDAALENPVAAGLAATADAYPFSGTPTPTTSTTPTV
jgi:hypothetical protein